MTNSDPNRLDRLEAIVESNVRAIKALSTTLATSQQEAQRDRARLYQVMADLAQSQAELAQTHAQFQRNIYQRQEELDQRQGELSRR